MGEFTATSVLLNTINTLMGMFGINLMSSKLAHYTFSRLCIKFITFSHLNYKFHFSDHDEDKSQVSKLRVLPCECFTGNNKVSAAEKHRGIYFDRQVKRYNIPIILMDGAQDLP